MVGSYNYWLVLLSIVVAITASYVALDLTSRVVASHGRRSEPFWLFGGAAAMGSGIWSMHFIGMLSYRMPMTVSYDVPITGLSLLIAVAASGFALYVTSRGTLRPGRLLAGSSLLGFAIAAMHYTGMAAMRVFPPVHYDVGLIALSGVIAVGTAVVALWSAFNLRMETIFTAQGACTCRRRQDQQRNRRFDGAFTKNRQELSQQYLRKAPSQPPFASGCANSSRRIGPFGPGSGSTVPIADGSACPVQGVAKRGATVKGILDRLLLQHNPDALLAISENGEILHWNDAAEAIFGYSCDEALGRLLNDLIVPPDRRDEERRIREDALRHGLAVYESVRRRKDGLLLHVSVTTKAIRDAGGNLECFLSTKKDVTHLKVLRDAKLVESKFRDLLESTPDAIVMVNITGRVVLINSQAENVFGYRRAEMMGQPVEMLLPQRFHAAHHGHRGQFFAQPRTRTMGAGLELYGLRKNGEEFPVEISLSTLSTDGGFGQRTDNEDVLSLYREIFSLVPAENLALYNWSLACGRVNGFSNVCGRTNVEEIAGNTHFHGQYPFAGIAYASVRSDREAVNFAFNDLGMTFVSLNNAQWVQLQSDGSLTLMDLALPSPDGILHWQGRPTILQIEPGQRVRLLKVSENSWLVESLDGDLPLFT